MSLPIYQTQSKDLLQLQTNWAQQINPVINNPISKSLILKDVELAIGVNTINHLLGRKLQGWQIVRQRAAAGLYDNQDSNPSPALTLVLVSTAAVAVDILVF